MGNINRETLIKITLLFASTLLAFDYSGGGLGCLIFAIIPIIWVSLTDKKIFEKTSEESSTISKGEEKIIKEENLIEQSRNVSVYLEQQMREIEKHPLVGEVRMKSFIGAVELVKDKETKEMFEDTGTVGTICRDYCIENGLVMRAVRDGMIFCPPLIFNNNHVDELCEKLKTSLDQTLDHISK